MKIVIKEKFDPARLERFIAARERAHRESLVAAEKFRERLEDLNHAKEGLRREEDPNVNQSAPDRDEVKRLQKIIEDSRERLAAADAARSEANAEFYQCAAVCDRLLNFLGLSPREITFR